MSFVSLVIGIVFQLMFAALQLLIMVFANASVVNTTNVTPKKAKIMRRCMVGLPLFSVSVAGGVLGLYLMDSQYASNWWHVGPLCVFAIYVAFILRESEKS